MNQNVRRERIRFDPTIEPRWRKFWADEGIFRAGRRAGAERRYILEMGRDVLPDLYPYLNDPDADVRAELCDILADLGDPDAITRLSPLISDPSAKVADRANRAVEKLRARGNISQ